MFSEANNTGANNQLVNIGTATAGNSGKVDLFTRNDSGTTTLNHSQSARNGFDDTWHHVVLVDNYGTATVYIDGTFDSSFGYGTRGVLTLARWLPRHFPDRKSHV